MKEFFKLMREINHVPKDGKAKTPCSKCLGLQAGCFIKMKRNPDEECGAFYDASKPIRVTLVKTP